VPVAFRLAARSADIVFITPQSTDDLRRLVGTVRTYENDAHREGEPLRVVADMVVFLDADGEVARARWAHLDSLYGRPFRSDALMFAGTPQELADLMVEWRAGGIDGFRLRPGAIPHDLDAITHELVPVIQGSMGFRSRYAEGTLRERMGLPRPHNRFAAA
jgi:alkanesulfonate monooxygenase SsuD/methylene tetrahydromethanopterin reductase-like flavin-dependent oxidoreductase (luciferase family)